MSNTRKHIKGRDLEIFYRHLQGMSNIDIATDLGIVPQTVSNVTSSDWCRNELAQVHARTLEKIATGTYSPMALARSYGVAAMKQNIHLMLHSKSDQVKQHGAWDILDRIGLKPAQRMEHVNMDEIIDNMSADEAEHYAQTGDLPSRLNANIVDYDLDITPDPGDPGQENPDTTAIVAASKASPTKSADATKRFVDIPD